MLKTILSMAGTGAVVLTSMVPLIHNSSVLGGKKLIFNNRQYNSYEEASDDYLNFIGNNISRNQYYGDIDSAIINQEMGIVDISKMREYNPLYAKEAYLTASGNTTSNIDVARNSYANMGNARTWYSDGVTDIPRYSYEEALSYGRSSIMTPVYSLVNLTLPEGVNGDQNDRNIKINPTNMMDIEMLKDRMNNSDLLSNLIEARMARGDNQDVPSTLEGNYDNWTVDFAIDRRDMDVNNSVYGDTLYDNSIVEISHDTTSDLFASTSHEVAEFYYNSRIKRDWEQDISGTFEATNLSGTYNTLDYNVHTNEVFVSSTAALTLDEYIKIGRQFSDGGTQSSYDRHNYGVYWRIQRELDHYNSVVSIDWYNKTGKDVNIDVQLKDGNFTREPYINNPYAETFHLFDKEDDYEVKFDFYVANNGINPLETNVDFEITGINVEKNWEHDSVKEDIAIDSLFEGSVNLLDAKDILGDINGDSTKYNFDYRNIELDGRYDTWESRWIFDITRYNELQFKAMTNIGLQIPFENTGKIDYANSSEEKIFNTRLSEANYRYGDDLKVIIKYHDNPIYLAGLGDDRELENISKYDFNDKDDIEIGNNLLIELSNRFTGLTADENTEWIGNVLDVLNYISEAKDFSSSNKKLIDSFQLLDSYLRSDVNFNQMSVQSLIGQDNSTGHLLESYLQYLNNLSRYWGIFYSGKTSDYFSTDKGLYDLQQIQHMFMSPSKVVDIEGGKIEWHQHVAYDRTMMNKHYVEQEDQLFKPISPNRIISISDENKDTFLENDLDFFAPKPMIFWVVYSVDGQELVSSSSKLDNSKFDVIELIIDNLNRLNPVKFASKNIYYNSNNGEQDELIDGTINNIYELNHRGDQIFFEDHDDIKTYIIEYIKENSIWK